MFELLPENRTAIHPLFADYPYLQGLVHGVLSGAFGQAFADQPERATVGMIGIHDFVFFTGDAASPTATAMRQSCPPDAWLIGQDASWHKRFGEQWAQLNQKERFAFRSPAVWDRERLTALRHELPIGYTLKPVTEADAARFAQLSASLVDFDAQEQPTMAYSVGFGIEVEGQFVAGCAGAPAGSMLDFEIQTVLAHRQRGLATAVAAAMILYCLDHNLKPCWDAANATSARLAEKLGFVGRIPYTANQIL